MTYVFTGDHNLDEVSCGGRKVYLPLSEIEPCSNCKKSAKEAKLRLCNACAEATYCSKECQQEDWKVHKVQCGKTDRIDFQSYFPFLACIAHTNHYVPGVIHPALERKIISTEVPVVCLPNGAEMRLLVLGEKMEDATIGSQEWWPAAPSEDARYGLHERIVAEGFLLPNMLAICIAVVSEMYTTTAFPPDDTQHTRWQVTGRRRVRLTYNNSPIADLGVVQGSVPTKGENRLAYFTPHEGHFHMGQDPNDHYRIYIKTLAGNEYYLDCGMFTFNLGIMVKTEPYCRYGLPDLPAVPAHFIGKEHDKVKIDSMMFKPRRRFSVLRDERVHRLVRLGKADFCQCHDAATIHEMMDEIAGRTCGADEQKMMMEFLSNDVRILRMNMQKREYVNFPELPHVGDVDAKDDIEDRQRNGEQVFTFLKRQAKKMKKGKLSKEDWEKSFYSSWAQGKY